MNKYLPFTTFAATYNCNAYGSSTYNNSETCETSTSTGGLAGTGVDIAIGAGSGVLLIALAAIILLKLRRKKPAKS